MTPKISVLMGIYNCAETLPSAIDCILSQTYTNWELILCNDGSDDNTLAVAKEYQSRFPEKIIVLENPKNMGLNHTLNRCLDAATGEFIARMDGDDLCAPERFQTELDALLQDSGLSVVSCAMSYFDEIGEYTKASPLPEYPDKSLLVHGTIHCHAPCMARTDAIRSVGGYSEDKKLLRVEDWHLWLKLYAAGGRGRNLPQVLYQMRDDRHAAGRRKFRYRLNEAHVAHLAVKTLKLPKWKYIYCLRPILVGLLPRFVYNYLHRRKMTQT